jgi:hypothetical protein
MSTDEQKIKRPDLARTSVRVKGIQDGLFEKDMTRASTTGIAQESDERSVLIRMSTSRVMKSECHGMLGDVH